MPMSHSEELNERQKEAAAHLVGPLLIVAGAGAGKTKTITHRIANLITSGVPPHSILAVTFTNKAAGEMRERIRALLPQAGGLPIVATFHALGVRLLREFHTEAGIPRGFSIWDRDDSIRVLKRILEKDESMKPRAVLTVISRKKGEGMTPAGYEADAASFRERAIARAWHEYEKALAEEGALDFEDLLGRTVALLRNNHRVRDLLQKRFSHITIDEYQDTNGMQCEIVKLLGGEARNICVVGDTDQNIYSWRGADIEHLLSFEKLFPGARTVLLEQNYRSTRTILAAANSIISKNTRRTPKTLFTENTTGEPLALYAAQNEIDEAWYIAQMIRELIEHKTPAGEIAVLYRENFQSRAIEEALLHFGVPYRVLGTRFFERKEVKDVLAYLRAAMNPKSKSDLTRIVAVPSRGIGKVTLDKMLKGEDDALPAGVRAKVKDFRDCILRIGQAIAVLPASEAVAYALEASGMEKMFKNDAERGSELLDNVRELVNLATRYDFAPPPEGIEKLLEEAALQSEQDTLDENVQAVSLMTAHASKGLEFDAVFITGLEQGLFPSTRENVDRDQEEERRLFYVALTRARKRLFLSYASDRMRYGERERTIPSEFLEDIDPRLMQSARLGQTTYEEETIT
jgi:DNA helicase-2/ATP-dependent DNA helicase PcrA